MQNRSANPLQPSQLPLSEALGLQRTLELTSAPQGKTFHYRNEDKRVIESAWSDEQWLRRVKGPCIYAVADHAGLVRYIGKHTANTPVGSRWYRRGNIHHAQSRNHVIRELDAGARPFMVWSAPMESLRRLLPAEFNAWDAVRIADGLEALWIDRWFDQLWNEKREPLIQGFHDNDFWQSAT